MPTAEIKDIGDLVPDPANCRKHNPRNIGAIVNSLQSVGAARSIVIDEDGVVLAGNGLIEAAGEAGITKVKVVEADGNTVIAVRRKGLTPKQKAQLGINDNRTTDLSDWNAEQLLQTLSEHEIDFAAVEFSEGEIAALTNEAVQEGATHERLPLNYKAIPTVKMVIAVPELADVELALVATGKANRGEALLEICRHYVSRETKR